MEKSLKIIIADNDTELGNRCEREFETYGMKVIRCEKDGKRLLERIKSDCPDAVLADIFMPNLDILGVLSALKEMDADKRPSVMAMSSCDNQRLEKEALQAGADYYFIKPFDVRAVAKRIIQLLISKQNSAPITSINAPSDNELEMKLTDIILQIGIPAHIKGYHYLRTGIIFVMKDPQLINAVTKQLYPMIAKKHGTTATRVERAIRHAIEVAWERGDPATLQSYFGNTMQLERGKPSNSEFIAVLSDKLRLKFDIKKAANY